MTTPEIIGVIAVSLTLIGLIAKAAQFIWQASKAMNEMPMKVAIKVAEELLKHEAKYVHITPEIESRAYQETRMWREKIETKQDRILEEISKKPQKE